MRSRTRKISHHARLVCFIRKNNITQCYLTDKLTETHPVRSDHIKTVCRANHYTGSVWRRELISRCRFLYVVPQHDQDPAYTRDMLQKRTGVRALRSTFSSQLVVPRSRLKGFGDRAFSIAAPRLWNALPGSLTSCKSVGAFKKGLKTHLFKSAF